MARRADVARRLATLVGENVLRITDARRGWPAHAELLVEGAPTPVALFVGPVGLTHRNRDDVERRFQNPDANRPIINTRPAREPLLLGLWETDRLIRVPRPLVVSADPWRRLDRTTRFSVFAYLSTLHTALEKGWHQDENATGEWIRCFVPSLLPLSYAADQLDAAPETVAMHAAIEASGLLAAPEPEAAPAAERARRAGSTLVRDARFSRRIVRAYAGLCAMCGLDSGLVQGAHIHPVAAPGSHDEPWNGLALCANHHLAFDRHVIGVDPATREVRFHHTILDQFASSPAGRALVTSTFRQLAEPAEHSARPRREMFQMRYAFFTDRYNWL